MHDAITVGLPLLAILFGILLNQQGLRDLRSELKSELTAQIGSLRSEMITRFAHTDSRIDRVQADLQQFYRTLGEHEKAIEIIERRDK